MNDSRIRTPKKSGPKIQVNRKDYENHRLDQPVAVSPPIHPLTEKSKLARVKSLSKSPSKSKTAQPTLEITPRALFDSQHKFQKCSDLTFEPFNRKEAENALKER